MIVPEIYKFLSRIELKTKKLLSGPLLSDWRSKQKGTGFEFHQLRDYQQGDDVRFIDWKSSAKVQKLLVREYLEDRNRIILLVVDASASQGYGSSEHFKTRLVAEISAVLAFAALHTKDSVGLLLFTDEVEVVLRPAADRAHVLFLLQTLLTHTPKSRKTDMNVPLKHIASMKHKNALVCFISDFTAPLNDSLLKVVARRHELVAFRCSDPRELSFPDVGTLIFEDSETHKESIYTTHMINTLLSSWRTEQEKLLRAAGIDLFDSVVGQPFMKELVKFLRQRGR